MKKLVVVFQFRDVTPEFESKFTPLKEKDIGSLDFLNLSLGFEEAVNRAFSRIKVIEERIEIQIPKTDHKLFLDTGFIFESDNSRLPETHSHDIFVALYASYEEGTTYDVIHDALEKHFEKRDTRGLALGQLVSGTQIKEIIQTLDDPQPGYHFEDVSNDISADFSAEKAALIVTFIRYGSILISRAEQDLGALTLNDQPSLSDLSKEDPERKRLWSLLANINRYFCLMYPAIRDQEREFCERIMHHYRMRERRRWLDGIRRDIEAIHRDALADVERKNSEYARAALNYIVISAVPATIFAAIVAVNSSSVAVANAQGEIDIGRLIISVILALSIGLLPALGIREFLRRRAK